MRTQSTNLNLSVDVSMVQGNNVYIKISLSTRSKTKNSYEKEEGRSQTSYFQLASEIEIQAYDEYFCEANVSKKSDAFSSKVGRIGSFFYILHNVQLHNTSDFSS